jgi:uncharacterized protein (DUF302 family)
MMKTLPLLLGASMMFLSAQAMAADPAPAPAANPYLQGNPYLQNVPTYMPFGITLPPKQTSSKPWTMSRSISKEEKAKMMKQMMPMMSMGAKMDIKDTMNYMTTKYKAKKDLAFDDVVESMKLRANSLNFKLVSHSPMWKDIQAVLGDTESPRMEVFHFCDIAAGREIMKLAPESIVYLPCRIAVMEDAEKNVWVLTLDWDIAWLDSVNGSMGIDPKLAAMAKDIHDKMDNIMQAGVNGDL